ncbi:MAG: nucleotidyltransferase domain-containing protein [Actinomycetota bacterium]
MGEAALNEALAVAARGLPGAGGEQDTEIVVSDEQWPAFIGAITAYRLTGLALAAITDGGLSIAPAHAEEIEARHTTNMLRALALERRMLQVYDAFASEGIAAIVLKGPVLANTIYADPSLRPFLDIDLLVHSDDWRTACGVLAALGFRRGLPEPKAGFDERFGKAALHRDQLGQQLDLHRTLVLGPFGLWARSDELFENTSWFELGGQSLRRLDDTALLVHACVHAALGARPPLPIPLRDVAEIASRGDVDWERFADLVSRWRLGAVIEHTSVALRLRLDVAVAQLDDIGRRVTSTRAETKALLGYTTDRRQRGGMSVRTLSAIPTLRGKASYARSLLVPDRDFLDARASDGHRSYLKRWGIALGWLSRAP